MAISSQDSAPGVTSVAGYSGALRILLNRLGALIGEVANLDWLPDATGREVGEEFEFARESPTSILCDEGSRSFKKSTQQPGQIGHQYCRRRWSPLAHLYPGRVAHTQSEKNDCEQTVVPLVALNAWIR